MSKEEVFQILINKPSKPMVVDMGMVMTEDKYKSVIAEEKHEQNNTIFII